MQHTILVVDDEAPMRKLISTNLKARGFRVLTAADGDEALRLVDEHQLDLLLLDIGLPGADGLTVVHSIRRQLEVPVLILSARGREADKVQALELGADDYLTKPFGVDELIARVRALLRRTTPGAKTQLPSYQYQDLEVDFSARRARLHGAEVPLTRREYDVLAFMARNSSKVLLHREILQGVWGNEYREETDYVWTFVQRIRRKIEADRAHPKYVLTEAGVGYRMPTAADIPAGATRE